MKLNFKEGEILNIDKPYGITSFKALAHIRYILSKKIGVKRLKIGHSGTLDPLATGVLILCTGKATKKIELLQGKTKEYVTTIQFGATTPSYDMEHQVNQTFDTSNITLEKIEKVIPQFVGNIQQVPPSYSACKINGQRAYDLKRSGEDVQLSPKNIVIHKIEIINFDKEKMQLTLQIVCGKGTYIRSLARDLGRALNNGAYLVQLRRTKVGDACVENSIDYNQFEQWLNQQEIEDIVL